MCYRAGSRSFWNERRRCLSSRKRVDPQDRADRRAGADGGAADAAVGHGKKSLRALELPTEGKRVMVGSLQEWYGYPVGQACELVELPRSSYYYRSHKADESQLEADLKEVAGQYADLRHTAGDAPVAACALRLPGQSQAYAASHAPKRAAAAGQTPQNAAPPTAIIPIRAIPTWSKTWKSPVRTRCGSAISPTSAWGKDLSTWRS